MRFRKYWFASSSGRSKVHLGSKPALLVTQVAGTNALAVASPSEALTGNKSCTGSNGPTMPCTTARTASWSLREARWRGHSPRNSRHVYRSPRRSRAAPLETAAGEGRAEVPYKYSRKLSFLRFWVNRPRPKTNYRKVALSLTCVAMSPWTSINVSRPWE